MKLSKRTRNWCDKQTVLSGIAQNIVIGNFRVVWWEDGEPVCRMTKKGNAEVLAMIADLEKEKFP